METLIFMANDILARVKYYKKHHISALEAERDRHLADADAKFNSFTTAVKHSLNNLLDQGNKFDWYEAHGINFICDSKEYNLTPEQVKDFRNGIIPNIFEEEVIFRSAVNKWFEHECLKLDDICIDAVVEGHFSSLAFFFNAKYPGPSLELIKQRLESEKSRREQVQPKDVGDENAEGN